MAMPRTLASPFTPAERDLIRLELMPRFGQEPDLANGLFLRTWRDGPRKGQPKIRPAVQGMLDRGLVRVVEDGRGLPRVLFTDGGLILLVTRNCLSLVAEFISHDNHYLC